MASQHYKDAVEIAKSALNGAVSNPGKESADAVADFIERLAARLDEIDLKEKKPPLNWN